MRYLIILYKMEYRNKLNPEHSLRMAHRIKGMRQKIIVIHNITSTIKFPNLGSDSVIICGTANLFFNIKLSSMAYPNRMIVSNIGRAIMKNLAVKFKGNEILSIDNFDVIACYRDLWKTKSEKRNATRQGISNDGCTVNCMKLRSNAGNKDATNAQDTAIASAYGTSSLSP